MDRRFISGTPRRSGLESCPSLTAEQQALLKEQLDRLTDAMWQETATEDEIAIACLTGGECAIGEGANMALVRASEEDLKRRDDIATRVILARWAERCGEECGEKWNATVGPIVNLKAEAP